MRIDKAARAKEVLEAEAKAIHALKGRIGREFNRALGFIMASKGRVVVSGMGKTGIIAQKLSATLASTGTPSLFLHVAEAVHGDLGKVTREDTVILLSYSGTTAEMKQLLPILKKIGCRIIGMTGNRASDLARYSDVVLDVSVEKEACPLNLAPTTSTTACLAMADALAVCLLELKGFKEKDFAFYHPGGALGRKLLLTVADIMRKGIANPVVKEGMTVSQVLMHITHSRAGSASVVDGKGRLTGIFTDGDLRRHLETAGADVLSRKVREVMTRKPTTATPEMLAAEAMRILQDRKIDEVPVLDAKGRPVGLLDVQDLLKAGVVA